MEDLRDGLRDAMSASAGGPVRDMGKAPGTPTPTPPGPLRPGNEAESHALLQLLDVPRWGGRSVYEQLVRWGDARVALSRGPGAGPSKSREGRSRDHVARERLGTLDRLGG